MSLLSQILQSILSLLSNFMSVQKSDGNWQRYGNSLLNQSSNTIYSHQNTAISSILSTFLGPQLGSLAGGIISRSLLPQDFNRFGGFDNPLSGNILPLNGSTYSGSFQNLIRQSQQQSLRTYRLDILKNFDRDVYRKYYSLTLTKGKAADGSLIKNLTLKQFNSRIDDYTEKALKKTISTPGLLNMFLDPLNKRQVLSGVEEGQAGALMWLNRRNPLSPNSYLFARKSGKAIVDMAILANNIGIDKNIKGSYGGFSGGAVALLSGILMNAQDTLGGDPKQIDLALKKFKLKIKSTSLALMPLRDLFGQDMKSMVNMLQSVSGMSIAQLSANQIKDISRNTVDAARFSGYTPQQMASFGSAMSNMARANNVNGMAAIGLGTQGGFVSGIFRTGMTPYGMTDLQFKSFTLNRMASGAGSANQDLMAMAYSMYKNKALTSGATAMTSKLFTDQALAMARGGDPLAAARKLAGVKSNSLLYAGRGFAGYRLYQTSGLGARAMVHGQYTNLLNLAMVRLRQSGGVGSSDKLVKAVQSLLQGASALDLAMLSNNPTQLGIKNFLSKSSNETIMKQFGVNQYQMSQAINKLRNDPNNKNLWPLASILAGSKQQALYQKVQDQIRQLLGDFDKLPGTGFNALFKTLGSTKTWEMDTTGKISIGTNGKKISKATALLLGRQILGSGDGSSSILQRMHNVYTALGSDNATAAFNFAFLGKGKDNQKFREALNRISNVEKGQKRTKLQAAQDAKDKDYINQVMAVGGNTTLTSLLDANDTDLASSGTLNLRLKAKSTFNSKMQQANLASSKGKTLLAAKLRLLASQLFRNRLMSIQRLKDTASNPKLLLNIQLRHRASFKSLLMKLASGLKLTDKDFKGNINKEQYLSYKKRLDSGYDLKSDVFNKLNTVLDKVLILLKNKGID